MHKDMIAKLASIECEFREKQKRNKKQDSLWNLINSIHSSVALREWVTLESKPLTPMIDVVEGEKGSSDAIVHLLIASLKKETLVNPPWAYIAWHWPSGRLLAMLDLRGMELPTSLNVTVQDYCTKEIAEKIHEEMLKDQKEILPSLELQNIYTIIRDSLPLGKRFRKGSPEISEELTEMSEEIPETFEVVDQVDFPKLLINLEKTKDLILESGRKVLQKECSKIYRGLNSSHFSIAVVGDFSRGKSTLINKLIDKPILAVGDVPTTTHITIITNGEQSEQCEKGNVKRITLPNRWLEETKLQLIDTPGLGDINGGDIALVSDVISSCDATLVVVSATMPLSLTERVFIEKHVLSRKVPRVAVVLTRMDQISELQREKLISFVKEKISNWKLESQLWVANDLADLADRGLVDIVGPEAIRNKLCEWALDPRHLSLKHNQIQAQTADLLFALQDSVQTEMDFLRKDIEEQLEVQSQLKNDIKRSKLDWEDLRLAMDTRERECSKWLAEILLSRKQEVFEDLCFGLRQSNNPKLWWEQSLPYLLNRKVLAVGKGLEETLQRKIVGDAAWLHNKVKENLSWAIEIATPQEVVSLGQVSVTHKSDITDVNQVRTLSRMGFGLATVASYMVLGPLAIAVPIAGGVIGDKVVSRKGDQQREELTNLLGKELDKVFDTAIDTIKQRINNFYKAIQAETQKQEALWFEARMEAINIDKSQHKEIDELQEYINGINDLLLEMTTGRKEDVR